MKMNLLRNFLTSNPALSNNTRSLSIVIISIGLGILVTGLLKHHWSPSQYTHPHLVKLMPDFVVINGQSTDYNSKGNISYIMSAQRLEHFPQKNISELHMPHIQFNDKKNNLWEINAKFGLLKGVQDDNLEEVVEFRKNVILKPINHEAKDAANAKKLNYLSENTTKQTTHSNILLSTQSLFLFPKEARVTTKSFVEVIDSGNKIESTGLNADLNSNKIWLKAKVRGIHNPS